MDGDTDRQTDRDRDTERDTDRQTDTEIIFCMDGERDLHRENEKEKAKFAWMERKREDILPGERERERERFA